MNKDFPTIKQMEEAILFAAGSDVKCEYCQDIHTFFTTELIPYPVRDSGGSIDSIGFEENVIPIDFQQAYHYWVAMMDELEGKVTPIPAPVAPQYCPDYEIDDLPF